MSCCSLSPEEVEFKHRSLRDATLCIGWFKMMSITFYISLYYLTKFYSHGFLMPILEILLLVATLPALFLGMMLFLGSLQDCGGAVSTSLITCYLLATYDLIVGLIGAGYHVAFAIGVLDYILTLAFILLALTSLPAFCHDVFVINSYRQMLQERKGQCCKG